MDRLVRINNLNQRYGNHKINQAIASSVLPITLQSGGGNQFNGGGNFLNTIGGQEQGNIGNLPISITTAQMETHADPYSGLSRMTAAANPHESRFGEIIYQNGDPRSKVKTSQGAPQPATPGVLACLLPGILTLFLLIFVISCIVKHNRHPFSVNSLRYYLEHPGEIRDTKTAMAVLLARQDQGNLERMELQNLYAGGQPGGVDGIEFEASRGELPVKEGSCREGLHYFNGLCYPCKVGHWNGFKCTTEPVQQIRKQGITNTNQSPPIVISKPIVSSPSNQTRHSQKYEQLHRFNKDFISQLNSDGSNTQQHVDNFEGRKCREGEFLQNGKCVVCPRGLVWNGRFCERRRERREENRQHQREMFHNHK